MNTGFSFLSILLSPAFVLVMTGLFLLCIAAVLFFRTTQPKWCRLAMVLLVICALYLLFVLWLSVGFGSNPGPAPTPQ